MICGAHIKASVLNLLAALLVQQQKHFLCYYLLEMLGNMLKIVGNEE